MLRNTRRCSRTSRSRGFTWARAQQKKKMVIQWLDVAPAKVKSRLFLRAYLTVPIGCCATPPADVVAYCYPVLKLPFPVLAELLSPLQRVGRRRKQPLQLYGQFQGQPFVLYDRQGVGCLHIGASRIVTDDWVKALKLELAQALTRAEQRGDELARGDIKS